MKLHELRVRIRNRARTRVGRGGKRGHYSGRGVKGQRSRAGRRIRPAVRDLLLRLPKLRGFRNKPVRQKPAIVNLGDLARAVRAQGRGAAAVTVDAGFLKKEGYIPAGFRGAVKILGKGDAGCPLEIRGILVSQGAREKIEKAGGKIEEMIS